MKEVPYVFFLYPLPLTANTDHLWSVPFELSRSGAVREQSQTVFMLFHSCLCAAAPRPGDKTTHRRSSSILDLSCTYIKHYIGTEHLALQFLENQKQTSVIALIVANHQSDIRCVDVPQISGKMHKTLSTFGLMFHWVLFVFIDHLHMLFIHDFSGTKESQSIHGSTQMCRKSIQLYCIDLFDFPLINLFIYCIQ